MSNSKRRTMSLPTDEEEDVILVSPFEKMAVSGMSTFKPAKKNLTEQIHEKSKAPGKSPFELSKPKLNVYDFKLKSKSPSGKTQKQLKETVLTTLKDRKEVPKDIFEPRTQDLSSFCKRLNTISLKENQTIKLKTQNKKALVNSSVKNCAEQARYNDVSVDDLAGYLDNSIIFPKKMSYMAEMMYT